MQQRSGRVQSVPRELSAPAVLEPDLHARLGQADLHRNLLAHEDVRVARLHEQRLEHVELRACERRALAPLLLPHAAANCARREMEIHVLSLVTCASWLPRTTRRSLQMPLIIKSHGLSGKLRPRHPFYSKIISFSPRQKFNFTCKEPSNDQFVLSEIHILKWRQSLKFKNNEKCILIGLFIEDAELSAQVQNCQTDFKSLYNCIFVNSK